MATLTHTESKRLYSWWWNSHISPKNSKWLQENLADMDIKVKSMIKLIEEDADSFRKRAEMYYRKRPELMKLVEEFYRAYRALAERYDHATGALRQAHRTMAEAFPDQILLLPDESFSASSAPESGHHTPKYDSDDFKKDTFGISLQSDYSDVVMIEDEDSHKKVVNGKARKGLNFDMLDAQEVEEKQNLKNQVTHELERANKAEIEVENLKIAISKLEAEKEAVFIQQKLYQERISSLEADIMSRQEDVKKLNEEMLVGMAELKNAKDLCHLLEKRNQSLQLDVATFNEKAKKKEEELNMKQEELEKIEISLKDECQRSMQLEELHSRSEEEVRLLGLEVQEWADKLKHAETSKVDLEEQIRRLKVEIGILTEQNCSYALKIIELQDEISLLEEFKRNHIEENKVLLQELSSIKADKRDLEQRHHELTEQIGVVNLGVESLQSLVKELRDGNLELKEICKKNEVETILHLENLRFMEKITERNGLLETSLSNANAGLDELREKVKTLEESCETLHGKISMHIAEKAVLVSQIEAVARNFENLSKKNTLFENSLSDMNVELEGLRGMLNASEESCQSLRDQNLALIAEKTALIAEVESIGHSLKNLESRYTESEGNNLNLQREKDLVLDQVTELQHSLKLEKKEHESLMQTSKSQLATLEHQIYLLQEKGRLREVELDAEHHKIVHAQIEIFILQKYLYEMKEKNMILAEKFQCKEELVSNLEVENSIQNERLSLLSQHNEMLVEGINQVRKTLNISKECSSPYDQHFKLILLEIEDLKASLLDAQDDNQHLILEKSVILTLLEQFVLDAARLMSQRDVFEQESKLRYEEVLALQSESHRMLEINEQLKQNLQACNRREEVLKEEIKTVCEQLADLQEAHSTLQSNFGRSSEVNGSLSKQINDLRVENDALELEGNAFLAQRMDFEYLYLVFKSSNADRALELQLLHDNMDHLHKVNSSLEYEIQSLNEKLGAAEVENVNLKEVLLNMEEYKRQLVAFENEVKTTRNTCELLSLQIEMGKNLVVEKDMEFQAVQDKNMELTGTIQGLVMAIDEARGGKEVLEKENLNLIKYNTNKDAEIAQLREANDALNELLGHLFEETQELKNRDKCLTYELQNRNEEIESCEVEFEALLNDMQITTINATTFEERMLDLLIKCESLEISAMIQKEMLYEEITRRNAFEDELKEKLDAVDGENRGLKEELGAYLPLVLSLGDYVASLKGRIISLAKQHSLSNQDQLDSPASLHQQKSNEEGTEDHFAVSASGIFELQKLQARVSALEDVVIDIQDHLEQNRSIPNISLLTTERQNEELPMGKDIILHLNKREDTGICEGKSEQSMKDIQLDHVLSSSRYDKIKDEMMEMWETMVNEEKSESSSSSSSYKLASEKELAIDTVELTESSQEKSASLSERLSADAQRLALIDRSAKEIKRNMELSEISNNSPTNFEFNKVKAQLKEAEGVISHLIDTNKKLTKKADKLTNELFNDRMGNTSERRVTERARRGSEKIGRLELELQKLEYIWLKLKEEDDSKRARAADRRTRVLLRDYLYGKRESPRRKKVHCCACMRPRTKDD